MSCSTATGMAVPRGSLPEAPVPVVKVEQIEDRPGGAANVALNIAALGAPASLVGVTGQNRDALGTCSLDQALVVLERALAVIRQHQHLDAFEQAIDLLAQ